MSAVETADQVKWFGVVATLAAVVVALLKEEIVKLWRRPDLHVYARLGPPDCHKTKFSIDGNRFGDCYYLRLLVKNEGTQRVEKVQVFVSRLLRQREDAGFEEVRSFLPMNLRWSHSQQNVSGPEIFADGISPGMTKHCDLGCIYDPNLIHAGKFGGTPGETICRLDLEVFPHTNSHILLPGLYRLELRVAGANAAPVDSKIELRIGGDWDNDEAIMFHKHLRLGIVE